MDNSKKYCSNCSHYQTCHLRITLEHKEFYSFFMSNTQFIVAEVCELYDKAKGE
jgi:hypothetical protein